MFLRTVCAQELCTYQYSQFGDKITTAEGVNTQAEIVDVLVCMFTRAVLSPRSNLILDPYPCVSGESGQEMIFHPKSKDMERLKAAVKKLMEIREEHVHKVGASWTAMKARMSLEGSGLIKWIVSSNRSYLAPLQDDELISAFNTPFQYLLISAPPEREARFQALKQEHGSVFAFHGSPTENWHSILRNGLKNASNTALMTTGAAHGPGVYLGTNSHVSLPYATRNDPTQLLGIINSCKETKPDKKRQRTGNRFVEDLAGLVMIAICEVIEHPSIKKHGSIWVAPDESTVCTRFFIAFTDRHPCPCVQAEGVASEIRRVMEKLHVGESRSS